MATPISYPRSPKKEYKILEGYSSSELEEEVEKYLEEGWSLRDDLKINFTGQMTHYYQVITKGM